MSQEYDPTVKTLVETDPAAWPVLIGQPWAPTEVIDADIATVSGAADKVLHVHAADPYLLHLEFVSGHDVLTLPRKAHIRSALLEGRHELLVRTVIVLLRPEADSPQLTGSRQVAFAGESPYDSFGYQVIRIWQVRPELLLSCGIGTVPLAPISAVTEAELPAIMDQVRQRIEQPAFQAAASSLWSATYILLGLRYSSYVAEQLLQGVSSMEESSTYQAILARGETRGELRGEMRGEIAALRRTVLRLGGKRFGAPTSEVTSKLDSVQDIEVLEDMTNRLEESRTWEELLEHSRFKE